MTIISLLDLPLSLPDDSEARRAGLDTFISGLPEYLSRCKSYLAINSATAFTDDVSIQVRHMRVVFLAPPVLKRTAPMHSVHWRLCASLASLKK